MHHAGSAEFDIAANQIISKFETDGVTPELLSGTHLWLETAKEYSNEFHPSPAIAKQIFGIHFACAEGLDGKSKLAYVRRRLAMSSGQA